MAIDAVPLVVIGAGGHGRAVAELARLAGHVVVGFLDAKLPATEVDGLPVWPELAAAGPLPGTAAAIAFGVGDNLARLAASQRYASEGQPALVHPRGFVSPSVSLSTGTVVFPGAVVHTGARIGRAGIINSGAIVEHDCLLDAGVHVAPGAVLCGAVRVGEGTLIGASAVVLPGCVIGAWATVGAGAVVTGDVPDRAVVRGSPARPRGTARG